MPRIFMIPIMLLTLSLSSCVNPPKKERVKTPIFTYSHQTNPTYVWDYPRNTFKYRIEDDMRCIDIARSNNIPPDSVFSRSTLDKRIPEDCYYHPVDKSSNLYLGMDKNNFNKYIEHIDSLSPPSPKPQQ